jgi:hypothetical protein
VIVGDKGEAPARHGAAEQAGGGLDRPRRHRDVARHRRIANGAVEQAGLSGHRRDPSAGISSAMELTGRYRIIGLNNGKRPRQG